MAALLALPKQTNDHAEALVAAKVRETNLRSVITDLRMKAEKQEKALLAAEALVGRLKEREGAIRREALRKAKLGGRDEGRGEDKLEGLMEEAGRLGRGQREEERSAEVVAELVKELGEK